MFLLYFLVILRVLDSGSDLFYSHIRKLVSAFFYDSHKTNS